MPTYDYICSNCQYTFSAFKKISERNVPTESSCTNCGYDGTISQKIGATTTVSQVGSILSKTSDGWNDVLKRIKKASSKNNSIHTK